MQDFLIVRLNARGVAFECLQQIQLNLARCEIRAARDVASPCPDLGIQRTWVPYDQISRNLKRAIIASEDANFVNNNGYETDAILQAWEKNKARGKIVAGGSTISQQLARNLFLSREKSYVRKAQELVITSMLELWMDKERIFEIYLNSVEWGNGVYGAEAAAHYYYKTSASKLWMPMLTCGLPTKSRNARCSSLTCVG